MQATRQHILDTLEQRGSASARQLAHAFGMSAANLRRHLGILQARGLVTATGRRLSGGRGRPELVYTLASPAGGAGLELLTRALLAELTAGDEARTPASKLKDLAKRMLGEGPSPSGQLTRRLVASVQQLAPLNYKAHWEAKPQGPELVLGRCPYAAIIAEHPELCQMDAHMLEGLLGSPVEQSAKLQPGPHGLPQCVFKIVQGMPRR